MLHKTFQFEFGDLDIDLKQIEKVLGYGEGEDREIVDGVIQSILGEKNLFTNIRAEYRIFEDIRFVSSDKSLIIDNIHLDIHKIVFGQIRRSESVALFLSTAGEEQGALSRKSMAEGDPLRGYFYDMLGSIIADAAADRMQDDLEEIIRSSGKKITNRYSPGYCGWDVTEQHKLFKLMQNNFCGIRLTDSALMDPVKSISGIIGIGEKVRYNPYTCRLCDMKDCAYRETKESSS